jgi:bifunctional ADP-heptose synthase (sugar kinase/adenylyltransferase)
VRERHKAKMDTRTKIINAVTARLVANQGATVVSGYFDPLVASHAERLAELKEVGVPLLVLITTPADAILPARARAELVAGLAVVDYVCETAGDVAPHLSLEREHTDRLAQLIEHVHTRQKAAS